MGLAELEAAVRRDLEMLSYPRRDWMEPRRTGAGEHVYDVVIVGAGQSGLAAAAALMRERVGNLLVVDQSEPDRAGPWLTFARMITLRTPKQVTGLDLGLPNLTIEAWYEAQHGAGAWAELGLVPKETWAAYLAWYRRVLDLPVQWRTRVGALTWREEERCFEVPTESPDGPRRLHARRVVLATGIEGSGHWHVPAFVSDHLPPERYAHTRHDIDFAALEGKRIGVLGAGASAFDNAAVALERGAAGVHLFFRRRELVRVNPYRWAEFVGFLKHAGDLPDADRWRFIRQILRMGQLPPPDTYRRASQHEHFELHPASPWTAVREDGGQAVVTTPRGEHRFDFLILGTGFVTNLAERPELAGFADRIALWGDRYVPPAGEEHADLARHPYLGPSFEFVEREPGAAPYLGYLHNYTFGCLLSLGFGGASISGMKYSIPRLVSGLTGSLFAEDRDRHFAALVGYDQAEF